MIDSFYIAWRYVVFNKARSAILVACITLIAVLPLALEILLAESERQLLDRATSTPLVMGAKGSALDLVMNSLYFSDEVPELISMAATETITDMDLAVPIPLYVRFKARGFPIVGTTLDYFDFRGLSVQRGSALGMLGECVIGAAVAEALELDVGDSLLSSPETVFDLAGVYPLKMKVAGVLARNYSADDLAVFVDIKTAWVIEGLVHGHEDLNRTTDNSVIMERTGNRVVANAKLMQYTEITDANLDSFHFHGTADDYPVTAVIADPYDAKSSAILQGRFLDSQSGLQIVRPDEVVDALLQNIFRIKNVLDTVILVVGVATGLALVLVFALSLRLRQRELETIFRLGCGRLTTVRLIGAEIVIILGVSALLCLMLLLPVQQFSNSLVRMLLIH